MAPKMQQKEAQELIARTLGLAQGFDLGDIVFVATDTEWGAYFPKTHKAYNKLTEVGLAFLDTRDLKDVEPGRNGNYWLDKIRAVHYLLSDAADVKSTAENKHGIALHAAYHFEFGNTTIVDRDQLAGALLQDFKIIDGKSPSIPPKYRQIIFIGHDWNKKDERNLKDNGLDIGSIDNILAMIDSQLLHQHPGATSLGPRLDKLLDQYNCSPFHVHNGANDAVYILVTVILGALWDYAWREQKDGSWKAMENIFPGLCINGDEGIAALKSAIEQKMGGRCLRCIRYGHIEAECDKEIGDIQEDSRADITRADIGGLEEEWASIVQKLEARVDGPLVLNLQAPRHARE